MRWDDEERVYRKKQKRERERGKVNWRERKKDTRRRRARCRRSGGSMTHAADFEIDVEY